MIDPVTRWFAMAEIPNKTAAVVADIAEKTWFTGYPLHQKITLDRGTEFMAEFAQMVKNDYGLNIKPITTRNPQANAIIERVHQTIGNIIRTFDVQKMDQNDPWSGMILATTRYHVCCTCNISYHATGLTHATSVWPRCHPTYKIHNGLGPHPSAKTRLHKY
jgi:transposase InsO family protein